MSQGALENAAGKVYLLTGLELSQGTASLATPTWSFYGEAEVDLAGSFVASAGNIDDDSYDDILIGATGNDDGGSSAGKVYLIFGSSLGSNSTIDVSLQIILLLVRIPAIEQGTRHPLLVM